MISFLLLFPEGGIAVKPANSKLPPGNIKATPTPSKPDIKKEEGVDDNTNADTATLNSATEEPARAGSTDGGAQPLPEDSSAAPISEEEDYSNKTQCYYPLTVTIRNMPVKSLPILERSVNKPASVAEYMEKTMAERVRAKNWWVWFQIDRRDQELLGKLIQPAKPPENMFIPARVRVYKSKKKSKEDAEKKKKKGSKKDADSQTAATAADDNDNDDDNDDDNAGENENKPEDANKTDEVEPEAMEVDPPALSKDGPAEPAVSDSNADDTAMPDAPAASQEESEKSAAAKLEAEVVDFDAMEQAS